MLLGERKSKSLFFLLRTGICMYENIKKIGMYQKSVKEEGANDL